MSDESTVLFLPIHAAQRSFLGEQSREKPVVVIRGKQQQIRDAAVSYIQAFSERESSRKIRP